MIVAQRASAVNATWNAVEPRRGDTLSPTARGFASGARLKIARIPSTGVLGYGVPPFGAFASALSASAVRVVAKNVS